MSKEGFRYIVGVVANERGKVAEDRVQRVLNADEHKHLLPPWFLGYEKSDPHDDATRGIDGIAQTDIADIPIQIKSSEKGKEKAQKIHPRVSVVVILPGMYEEIIVGKVVSVVGTARKKLLESWGLEDAA